MAGIGYATLSVVPSMTGFGSKVAAGTTPAMATAGAAGGKAFGAAAMAGIAVIAAAGVVAVGAIFKIGESFKDASNTIRVGTGATGAALDGLKGDFRAVVAGVPASFGDASKAIADLNTRTGQTGKPLQLLSKQMLEMTRLTGGDLSSNIASVTRVFGDWSIKTGDQSKTMDYLFKVSQSTGIGIDSLSSKVVQFGAPLRQLGFSFDESAALLGKWEKEGVNTEAVLAGMKVGLGSLSKAGKEPVAALKAIQKAIAGAGSSGEANAIAIKTFGQRAGPDMAAAIREGRFSVEDLMKTLKGSSETILGAAKDTMTYKESWTIFKNKAMLELEPIATRVFQIFGDGMSWISANGIPTIKAFSGFMSEHAGILKIAAIAVGVLTVAVQAHNLSIFIATGGLKAWILQTTIVKTATATWSAIQWLLNAALTANPIGIVVVAVGLLIAGIVLIATKTTWFQTIWKTMTDALGAAWRWMWNSILAPIIRFVLEGFASIVDGIASMLRVLSNIPGFGWAKVAADKMEGAADKARALAQGIKDIPSQKDILINIRTIEYASSVASGGRGHTVGGNAAGTDYWRGGPTWVGERGPEIVNLPKGSQVIPNHKLGGSNSGATSADIAALGDRIDATMQSVTRMQQTMQRQMAGAR